jgi:hypothetical protein
VFGGAVGLACTGLVSAIARFHNEPFEGAHYRRPESNVAVKIRLGFCGAQYPQCQSQMSEKQAFSSHDTRHSRAQQFAGGNATAHVDVT